MTHQATADEDFVPLSYDITSRVEDERLLWVPKLANASLDGRSCPLQPRLLPLGHPLSPDGEVSGVNRLSTVDFKGSPWTTAALGPKAPSLVPMSNKEETDYTHPRRHKWLKQARACQCDKRDH
jgi:hypothetical protein